MSYISKMVERDKNARITVGCRCAFKKSSTWVKEKWFKPDTHCIIQKRSGEDFSVFVLPDGFTGKLTKDLSLYNNSVAWVHEDELSLIDRDYNTNLNFLDWYQEVKEDICGDCCIEFLNKEDECPNPKCPSNNLEIYGDLYDGLG